MGLESLARQLLNEWNYHSSRALHVQAPMGTVRRMLVACADQGRDASLLELRLIAKELDDVEGMLGDQVDRLLALIEQVRNFEEAVMEALADAEPSHPAPEWATTQTGIDDDVVDRIGAFYGIPEPRHYRSTVEDLHQRRFGHP